MFSILGLRGDGEPPTDTSGRGPPGGEMLYLHRETHFTFPIALQCPQCGGFEVVEALFRTRNGVIHGPYIARRVHRDDGFEIVEDEKTLYGVQGKGLCRQCWEEGLGVVTRRVKRHLKAKEAEPVMAEEERVTALSDQVLPSDIGGVRTRLNELEKLAAPIRKSLGHHAAKRVARKKGPFRKEKKGEPVYSGPEARKAGLTLDKEIAQVEAELADLEQRWEAKQRAKSR